MKNYTTPMLNLLMLENEDVIVTSTPFGGIGTVENYIGDAVDFDDL